MEGDGTGARAAGGTPHGMQGIPVVYVQDVAVLPSGAGGGEEAGAGGGGAKDAGEGGGLGGVARLGQLHRLIAVL